MLSYTTEYRGRVYYPGAVFKTNRFGDITIVGRALGTTQRFLVEFADTGFRKFVSNSSIIKGEIRDPLAPAVCGVGFEGDGEFSKKTHKRMYELWRSMLDRCYSGREARESYSNVAVDSSWYNLQTFCIDIQTLEGFSSWNSGKRYELDKDIIGDSTLYSRDTCKFLYITDNRSAIGINK